jgi:hypothetical protein
MTTLSTPGWRSARWRFHPAAAVVRAQLVAVKREQLGGRQGHLLEARWRWWRRWLVLAVVAAAGHGLVAAAPVGLGVAALNAMFRPTVA